MNTTTKSNAEGVREVSDFEQGCDLAYEAGRPLVLFVTEQGAKYKFFPSRIYENYPKRKPSATLPEPPTP